MAGNPDEALAERDALRVELDSVRCQADTLTQELRHELGDQRTVHDQRVEALNEAQAQARSSIAEQRSQLDALRRESTNLTTLNNSLSVRIDKTQAALASTETQLLTLKAERAAEQRESDALEAMMTARLADKDALIAHLQKQMTEPPRDPDAPDGNDTDGV